MILQDIAEAEAAYIFDISPSPQGIARKVWAHTIHIDRRAKEAQLHTVVFPVDAQGNELADILIKPYARIIYGRNERLVNPAHGYIVTADYNENGDLIGYTDLVGNVVNQPIGQFDYFAFLMGEPVAVEVIIAGVVQMCDIEGSFNTQPS